MRIWQRLLLEQSPRVTDQFGRCWRRFSCTPGGKGLSHLYFRLVSRQACDSLVCGWHGREGVVVWFCSSFKNETYFCTMQARSEGAGIHAPPNSHSMLNFSMIDICFPQNDEKTACPPKKVILATPLAQCSEMSSLHKNMLIRFP